MINADTYSEVYEILSYMNKSIVMKVPFEILQVIKENRNLKKILLIATGALMNSTSSQQGESIPGIAHAISIEV